MVIKPSNIKIMEKSPLPMNDYELKLHTILT